MNHAKYHIGGTYTHACVTDRAGIEPWVVRSRVQRLNHWAIKVPEWPSHLRLAGSLHYSPLFEIRAPWLGPLSTKAWSFHSQANPGYRCHQCNGPCGYRTPGRSLQSPTPKPLGHKGTWTTQSLMLGWFVIHVLLYSAGQGVVTFQQSHHKQLFTEKDRKSLTCDQEHSV